MLGRLREIDDELNQLPDQLAPLETQVKRGREILEQSEKNNPMRQTLPLLLRQADRNHIENLGWLVGQQSIDGGAVARHVARFLQTAVGKGAAAAAAPPPPSPAPTGEGAADAPEAGVQPYEQSLGEFVRVDGAAGLPSGMVEAALIRKMFGDPWLALDPKVRAHVMEDLKREQEENARWLPEPKSQLLDDDGKGLVGEGAGAFGGYFTSAALITIGARAFRMNMPTRTFTAINETMNLMLEDAVFKKIGPRFTDTTTTIDRARAVLAVAYIHLIRSVAMGTYEREHRKIVDILGSAEVALESGQKRIERLRDARRELVMQNAGIIGITMTILAAIGYAIYAMLTSGAPPPKG